MPTIASKTKYEYIEPIQHAANLIQNSTYSKPQVSQREKGKSYGKLSKEKLEKGTYT